MSEAPLRALVVGTGAIGGIGRYERLLVAALEDLQERDLLRFDSLWRRAHPPYLMPDAGEEAAADPALAPVPLRRFVPAFLRALRRVEPDVVLFLHANLAQLAPLARTFGRCPHIVSTYGEEVWQRLSHGKRLALRQAAQVWSISRFTADEMSAAQALAPDGIRVIPLALEPEWLRLGSEASRGPDRGDRCAPRLLSVSRLVPEARDKGIDRVLRSLPAALVGAPDLRYRIVGDGADRAYLEEVARESGVESRVTFTGALSHAQLLDEYRNCDLFVLPSEREGFGLVFVEAMAFAKPVVARRAAAAAEVVVHGETGTLIDGDADLATAILDLARDPGRARALGEAGRRRVEETYAFERFVGDVHAALSSTLTTPKSRAVRP